jgi:hypothetical protein
VRARRVSGRRQNPRPVQVDDFSAAKGRIGRPLIHLYELVEPDQAVSNLRWSSSVFDMVNTNCIPEAATVVCALRSIPRKNGSEKSRSSVSATRKATESLRPVTSQRAARLGA